MNDINYEPIATAMCEAAGIHLRCTYPECTCKTIPTQIEPAFKASVQLLIDIVEQDLLDLALEDSPDDAEHERLSVILRWLQQMIEEK